MSFCVPNKGRDIVGAEQCRGEHPRGREPALFCEQSELSSIGAIAGNRTVAPRWQRKRELSALDGSREETWLQLSGGLYRI